MTTAVAEQTRTVTNEVTPPDQLDFTGFNFAGGSGAGYYPSPNILIDDLLASGQIDAYDFTIISYIIRSTLGSKHKKSFKWIALTSIATQCNLSLSLVRDRLKVLADKSIVYRLDFMNQGVNQTWLAVNTDESTELIRRLAMNEIKPSYITGSQHTSILNRCFDTIKDKASKIVAMLSKTETLNTTPPPPKTPLPVFSDAVGVLNTVEAIPETGNKNKDIKKIYLKKQTNKQPQDVACFFKNNNSEEEEIIRLLTMAKYNDKKVCFNEQVAESLIKKFPIIGGRKLIDVVKEKVNYLKFETIDLNKYTPSSILYNMIKENRPPSEAYKNHLNKEQKQVESRKWLPILSIINETFNDVTAENAMQIIRNKFANMIDSDSNSDQKKLADSVVKMVQISNLSLSELTGFSEKRLEQTRKIVSKIIKSGEVKCDQKVLELLEDNDNNVSSDSTGMDNKNDKAGIKVVSNQANIIDNFTDALAGLVKNFSMPAPVPSMAMV